MVTVSADTIFQFPREKVWRLMELHMDDEVIRRIHPDVLTSKQLSRDGNCWVFERRMRAIRRTFNVTWRFELKPMETVREEIISSTGGIASGSFLENTYSDAGHSTRVSTTGEITLLGVPRFLQARLLKRVFNQTDKEDLEYLAELNPQETLPGNYRKR